MGTQNKENIIFTLGGLFFRVIDDKLSILLHKEVKNGGKYCRSRKR